MPSTEGRDKVHDVVGDIVQMCGQVGINLSQLVDAATLKALVIGERADVHGNILAQALSKCSPGVAAVTESQKLLVNQLAALLLNNME